jgi:transposase
MINQDDNILNNYSCSSKINEINYQQLIEIHSIKQPFHIYKTEIDNINLILHIYLRLQHNQILVSPCCNEPAEEVYSYNSRIIYSFNTLNYKTLIHYKKLRVKCTKCGRIAAINFPWEMPNSN